VVGACAVGTLGLAAPAGAATSVQIDDGTLQVLGDGANNRITLYNQQSDVVIDIGDDGVAEFTANRGAFSKIEAKGGAGDDDLAVVNAGGPLDTPITLDGGAGDDNLRGGAGAETLLGGTGDDVADGNLGADTARLGSGNDRFNWDPGDNSDTVEGEGGSDVLSFNGANIGENIDVTANGPRVRVTRNVAGITLDVAGVEETRIRAVGGADQISVGDLAGTGMRVTDVDLRSTTNEGDGAADTVTAAGTDGADRFNVGEADGEMLLDGPSSDVRVRAGEAQDHARIAAGGEADTIVSAIGVPGPGQVDVDGGDGADRATTKGTDSDDEVGIARNGDAVATFATGLGVVNHVAVESLTVQGLGGADRLAATNGIGAMTALTLDGGEGADDLRGADGADTLLGGNGDDHVDGNIGADTAKLGAGDDRFQWDPGDGSDVVEGQTGADAMDFNGSNIGEQIDVVRNAGRVRLTRNIAGITMDFDGIEASVVRALGGNDQVTVGDLSGTDLKTADVDLSASMGGGDNAQDTVVVNGRETADTVDVTASGGQVQIGGLPALTRISGSESLNDTLRVNTLGGKDQVTVDPNAELLITPVIDLGAGQ
jgi:hypothetical protein